MSGIQEPVRNDVELLAAVGTGDRTALSSLYERHAEHMLSLALKLLGELSSAEDLVHDVILEVWKNADSYRAERGSVRAWIRMRLRSRALDRRRAGRSAARHELAAGLIAADTQPSTNDTGRLADQSLALATLQELPEPLREVAQLVYVEGYTCTEVSRLCAVPHGTVKSRLATARTELRRIIANREARL